MLEVALLMKVNVISANNAEKAFGNMSYLDEALINYENREILRNLGNWKFEFKKNWIFWKKNWIFWEKKLKYIVKTIEKELTWGKIGIFGEELSKWF